MRNVLLLAICVSIGGCASGPQAQVEPPVFGRVDCQIITGNPNLERELEQSKAICLARSEATAVSGTAGMPVGYGIGGAIASGIERGMTQTQIRHATQVSCMAEEGYLIRTKSEHNAACMALTERPQPKRAKR